MKLLVASPHWLFLVDSVTHDVQVVEHHRREYYGISWPKDGPMVLSHSGIDHAAIQSFEEYAESEKGSLSFGQNSVSDFLSAPHQHLCLDDFTLVTNTGRNCLTVVRNQDLFYRHYWFDDIHWDRIGSREKRGSHFNSLFFKEGFVYLLAHNNKQPSFVLQLTWPSLEIVRKIATAACEAHNIWLDNNGQMIICNTGNASLDDVSSGEVLWQSAERNVFPRGLASAEGLVFVGQSKIIDRGGRASSHGGICVLDKNKWQLIDFIPLPFSGNIHEIRVLDSSDECHHGHPFTGIIEGSEIATRQYQDHVQELTAAGLQHGWEIQLGQLKWQNKEKFITGPDLTISTIQQINANNVRISALLGLEPHPVSTHIGLVGRYLGPADDNMYLGMLIQDGASYMAQIWKNIDGQWLQLAAKSIDCSLAKLTFEIEGEQLRLFADGHLLIETTDGSLTAPGKVGIRGLSGSVQNFTVCSLGTTWRNS